MKKIAYVVIALSAALALTACSAQQVKPKLISDTDYSGTYAKP
jgi:major membrane immunogen (membrane-anchored lipoprotein)